MIEPTYEGLKLCLRAEKLKSQQYEQVLMMAMTLLLDIEAHHKEDDIPASVILHNRIVMEIINTTLRDRWEVKRG